MAGRGLIAIIHAAPGRATTVSQEMTITMHICAAIITTIFLSEVLEINRQCGQLDKVFVVFIKCRAAKGVKRSIAEWCFVLQLGGVLLGLELSIFVIM